MFYQNVCKTILNFSLWWFLRFFDIFLKFKKKRGKKSGQNHKKYKIETIFDVNFERFKMVFWKYSREEKSSFYYFFSIPYFFFALWAPKRHKTWNETWESSLLQKEVLCKRCWICCKNSTNVAKIFSNNSLVPGLFPKIFFWCYINMFQRKTSEKLSN